jgi:hypothetical protein
MQTDRGGAALLTVGQVIDHMREAGLPETFSDTMSSIRPITCWAAST